MYCLSPSNCNTVSTMCSKTFGPARLPSLLICPIMRTGVPVSLANLRMAALHSLTCVTLPGDDSAASVYIVWIESMIIRSGLRRSAWARICSRCVSQ